MSTDYYVFLHRPGKGWLPDRPVGAQPLQGHFEYMTHLEADGVLVVGGGFLDGAGAMGVLRCESIEAANAVAEADPAVADGIVTTEVHPWFVTVGGTIIS